MSSSAAATATYDAGGRTDARQQPPPVPPSDVDRSHERIVLVLGHELDEPPRPPQRAVDPRLAGYRYLLHQHGVVSIDHQVLDLRATTGLRKPRDRRIYRLSS